MREIPAEYRLDSYTYELPEENIAQEPADRRDASRLLVLDRETGDMEFAHFADLPRYAPQNALVVANNSRVLPARILGAKPSGGKVEFLLLSPLPLLSPVQTGEFLTVEAEGLLKASKGPRSGEQVIFGPDPAHPLMTLTVLSRGEYGKSRVRMSWRGDLTSIFTQLGHMPLPPYIRRPDGEADRERYQTIYSDKGKTGSVAAPTAGLHFTTAVREELLQTRSWAEVTLYVGYGTFSPVRCEDIRDHAMHEEYVEVPEKTANAVIDARQSNRKIMAVGTTSARTLEGMHRALGKVGAFSGGTDIFIRPGYDFRVVDCLLTNFHLPASSLLIMVSALAGRDRVLRAYREALARGFRVFSYGDAMLIR